MCGEMCDDKLGIHKFVMVENLMPLYCNQMLVLQNNWVVT